MSCKTPFVNIKPGDGNALGFGHRLHITCDVCSVGSRCSYLDGWGDCNHVRHNTITELWSLSEEKFLTNYNGKPNVHTAISTGSSVFARDWTPSDTNGVVLKQTDHPPHVTASLWCLLSIINAPRLRSVVFHSIILYSPTV